MFKLFSIFQPGIPFLGLARFPSPVGKCEGSWTVHEWWAVHVIKGEGGGVSTGEYQDSGWSSGHWSCTIIVFISFRATGLSLKHFFFGSLPAKTHLKRVHWIAMNITYFELLGQKWERGGWAVGIDTSCLRRRGSYPPVLVLQLLEFFFSR